MEKPRRVVCNRHILLGHGGILGGLCHRVDQIVSVRVLIVNRVRNGSRLGVIEDDLLINLIDDDTRTGVRRIILVLLIRRQKVQFRTHLRLFGHRGADHHRIGAVVRDLFRRSRLIIVNGITHCHRLGEFWIEVIVFCDRHGKGERLFCFAILVEPADEHITVFCRRCRFRGKSVLFDIFLLAGVTVVGVERLHRVVRIGSDSIQAIDPFGIKRDIIGRHCMQRQIILLSGTFRVLIPAYKDRVLLYGGRLAGWCVMILAKRLLIQRVLRFIRLTVAR